MRDIIDIILEHSEFIPEQVQEASWWFQRYVSGSLNDPDWEYGEQGAKLDINQAMEILSRYVGNARSIGRPLYRYLQLTNKQIAVLEKTLLLMPNPPHIFQSFTTHEEDVWDIGDEIHFNDGKHKAIVVQIPNPNPADVMFGMDDFRRCQKQYVRGEARYLEDWFHQGEVIVRINKPTPIIIMKR